VIESPYKNSLIAGISRLSMMLAATLSIGCSIALPPTDATPTERYRWSTDRYETEKYADAIRGFRDLLFREPLHATSDSARYLLAESYLRTNQQLLAANEFRMLATSRPNSAVADDAQLGMCRAYWELSPSVARDQEYTRRTIEACTRLVEFFPRSDLGTDARSMISEARQKLAAKQARVGAWYYGLKLYESSIIYFESLVQEFPETDVIPSVLFLLHDSYSQVGFRSEANAVRDLLLARYPDSSEAQSFDSEPTDAPDE
jgi:outer membrane assembly lipoprotein YfiO